MQQFTLSFFFYPPLSAKSSEKRPQFLVICVCRFLFLLDKSPYFARFFPKNQRKTASVPLQTLAVPCSFCLFCTKNRTGLQPWHAEGEPAAQALHAGNGQGAAVALGDPPPNGQS
jgi:hypothetical protein